VRGPLRSETDATVATPALRDHRPARRRAVAVGRTLIAIGLCAPAPLASAVRRAANAAVIANTASHLGGLVLVPLIAGRAGVPIQQGAWNVRSLTGTS